MSETFAAPGANTITLSVVVGGRTVTKDFNVTAVSPDGYAAVGDRVTCPSDAHGCPACPHPTDGRITSGSPNVFVRGKPAARSGDGGVHAACCGPNSFMIEGGEGKVLINGMPAAKGGTPTRHCGGSGRIHQL